MTGEKCRLNEVVISIESLHSVIEINSLFCFAQTLLVSLAAPKLLTLGKMKEKQCFPFILRSFIRTFGCAEVTDTRQKKEKRCFPFILRSFIRTFAPMKKYSSQKVGEYTHYEVRKEQPLLEYLLETIEGQSRSKIKATLQGRGIKVDGKVVTQFDFPLRPGMKVAVSKTKRNDRFKSRYVKIVYEDRHLVVVEKEIGILSMAAGHASLNVKAVLDKYFAQTRQKCRAHVVHRLDRDTSGLMVYAKDMETEQILEHNWHDIVFDRRYVAVVSGEVLDEGGTIANWLKDNKAYFTYSSPVDNGGKYAVTHFHTLARTTDHSLLEFNLETGRKNQIRVHAADMGHPVCGDAKYGNGDDPLHRLCLHAYMLCFYHPITGEPMEFTTPVPTQFRKLFQ